MNESSSPIGFVAPEPSELAPLFPAYEIHDLIATGGMGAVYRAMQKSLDRTVALKILPMEFSEDVEFCAGFEAEAKAMARLNHPNLIGVHDFGEVNGMLFIVMEFVRGKSLYHSAKGRAIDPREAARLVTGICNGLAHAHENGILHRDIKPSNILLTPQAEPKIGDFGLARPVEHQTQTGEVIFGTPGYTAPEVVNAPGTADHRADLFSVGVLLHELLTGKLPADDPRPASLIVGCDTRFDAIIRRATNQLPSSRYSSAAEIATELQKITTARVTGPLAKVPGGPRVGAPGPPQPRRTRPTTVKRKSWNFTWIGPLLAIGIMAFSWYKFMNMKPRVITIKEPAAKSSTSASSGRNPQNERNPVGRQSSLPLQPPMQPKLPPSVSKGRDIDKPRSGGNPTAEVREPRNDLTPVFNATDLTSLRQKITQHATVQGRVLKTGVNNAGTMRFLNFSEPYANSLSVRMVVSDAPDQFTDIKLKEYVGKSIQFSGIVREHQETLQIQVRSLAQLKIVEAGQVIGMKSIATDSPDGTANCTHSLTIPQNKKAESMNQRSFLKIRSEGAKLTPEEVVMLERTIAGNPNDTSVRLRLIGYYMKNSKKETKPILASHYLWIIENLPDSKIFDFGIHYELANGDTFEEVKSAWLKQIKTHPENANILENASGFFKLKDSPFAEDCLIRGIKLEPNNASRWDHLGSLYQYGGRDQKVRSLERALAAYERAETIDTASKPVGWRNCVMAKIAYNLGDFTKSEKYATDSLKFSKAQPNDYYSIEIIHYGNTILGLLAMKNGDINSAKDYLLKSAKASPAPSNIAYNGPNMSLAKELLGRGEKSLVLEYFTLCGRFWKSTKWLEAASKQIADGGSPDFNRYLRF